MASNLLLYPPTNLSAIYPLNQGMQTNSKILLAKNYLKFIERARTEMIYQQFSLNHNQLKNDHDVIFVVRSCNIKYLKSAYFEDELKINTSVASKTPVRLNLIQEVKRKAELLVLVEVELAVINSKGSVKKLSLNLLEKI